MRHGGMPSRSERVTDPTPISTGSGLHRSGHAVLARLGLIAPIREHGARIDRRFPSASADVSLVELGCA
jgi:hypothetical protein